jgi:hypothetical protein
VIETSNKNRGKNWIVIVFIVGINFYLFGSEWQGKNECKSIDANAKEWKIKNCDQKIGRKPIFGDRGFYSQSVVVAVEFYLPRNSLNRLIFYSFLRSCSLFDLSVLIKRRNSREPKISRMMFLQSKSHTGNNRGFTMNEQWLVSMLGYLTIQNFRKLLLKMWI